MQIQCPKCQGLNEIDAEFAGQVVACGHCNAHLRVPAAKRPAASAAARPSAVRRAPAPATPPPDDGYEEVDDTPQPKKKKKKKKAKRYSSSKYDDDNYNPHAAETWIGAGCGAFLFIVALVVSCFWPTGGVLMMIVGGILTLIGRWWFVGIAYEEDFHHGLMCMWLPFYSTYYFFTRMTDTLKPFLIGALGYAFLISGFILFLTHHAHKFTEAEKQAQVAFDKMDGHLNIAINGKKHNLKMAGLFHAFDPKKGPGPRSDIFRFEDGEGTEVYGTFPAGFRGDWKSLAGKTLQITSAKPGEAELVSEICLDGDEKMVGVNGGSLLVERVEGDDKIPVLIGKAKLRFGEKTEEGTFRLPIHLDPIHLLGGGVDDDD